MATADAAPSRRSRLPWLIGVGAAVIAVAALVAALLVVRAGDEGDDRTTAADAAVATFVAAVNAGRPGEGGTVQPAADVQAEFDAAVAGLGAERTLTVSAGPAVVEGDVATAPLRVEWGVAGASWTSTGTLELEHDASATDDDDPAWRARWALAGLDARLGPGDVLAVEQVEPERAPILDGAGAPLVAPTDVVVIGVQPRRATDVDALTAELARILGIDGEALAARIRAAGPDAFVDVITLRRPDYDQVRDQVRPLPGTVFREESQLLSPSRGFARPLLGTVGPATDEQIAASEGRLEAGDLTGQGGIQEAYDEQLRGTPGLVVLVVRGDGPAAEDPGTTTPGTTTPGAEPGEPEILETVDAVTGVPVRTTLDVATQQAAESALVSESRVSTVVAVRVSTSEVLAVANAPSGTSADVGLRGRVAPGSTFKVVSTLALLRGGFDPAEVVPCPQTTVVGGREFGNAGGFVLGDVPFRTDFARSCNTAFVDLSTRLGPDDLTDAALQFGLGAEWDIGLPAYTGSVPATEGPVDQAAAMIGQGRLETSPLSMAMVASTVAAGRWRAPVLVADPAPSTPAEIPLDATHAEVLRDLMRGVVTEGTGSALDGVPGGEAFAKTGTAEFGTDDPPRSHAWIIGFQGDIAFAVFVEGGESGRGTAGPIAAAFLTALQG